jgi:hypothetical protein
MSHGLWILADMLTVTKSEDLLPTFQGKDLKANLPVHSIYDFNKKIKFLELSTRLYWNRPSDCLFASFIP